MLRGGGYWLSGKSGVSHWGVVGLGSDKGVHFHFISAISVWIVVALGRLGFESCFGLLGA